MKTVLVTGGAGFIGSNFVNYVVKKHPNYSVIIVDALTYAGSVDNIPKEFSAGDNPQRAFWYGNICNAELVLALVAEADVVVHFAAETHVTRSIYDNQQFFMTDVLGTHTIANAVLKNRHKVRRLIHISSSEVYGTAETPLMDEHHPLNPMSPYASAKCGADRLMYSYWATYKLPVVIVRPFNNYGQRQHLEKVVPRFITSAILGEPITVHGDGSAARDFLHVDDTCRALDMIIHADDRTVTGEVFNLASGVHRPVRDIGRDVIDAMEAADARIVYNGDRPGQVVRHSGDAGKIKRILGWEPSISWTEGLRSTIDWYRDNRDWWERQLWMRKIPITTSEGKVEFH